MKAVENYFNKQQNSTKTHTHIFKIINVDTLWFALIQVADFECLQQLNANVKQMIVQQSLFNQLSILNQLAFIIFISGKAN